MKWGLEKGNKYAGSDTKFSSESAKNNCLPVWFRWYSMTRGHTPPLPSSQALPQKWPTKRHTAGCGPGAAIRYVTLADLRLICKNMDNNVYNIQLW